MSSRVVVSIPAPIEIRDAISQRLAAADLDVIQNPGGRNVLDADGLSELLPEAVGIIVGPGQISAKLIGNSTRLRAISKFGVGVESIDLEAATRAGIGVTYTPGVNADAVADLTVAFILLLARRIPTASAGLRAGLPSRPVGMDLSGKTLGLVGLGSIGRGVARRAQAFGMTVIARGPTLGQHYANEHGITILPMEALLPRCDVLSIHTPLTAETKGLIGDTELAALPAGAFLVNTARGGIVDETALLSALTSGRLAGAGLDVFVSEPAYTSPLLTEDSVIATPHIGGATYEAFMRAGMQAADNLTTVLRGERCPTLLNPEALEVPRDR